MAEEGGNGERLIVGGWVVLLIVGLPVIVWPGFFYGAFSGGPVGMRDWMWVLSSVMRATQLLGLAMIVGGIWRHARPAGFARWAGVAAGAAFGVAGLVVLAGLAMPYLLEPGPWEPFAAEPTTLRHIGFAPAVLQGMGLLALFGAIGAPRLVSLPGAVLAGVGAALGVHAWMETPQALMPRPLVGMEHPGSAVLWVAAFVLLALGLVASAARTQPGADAQTAPLN